MLRVLLAALAGNALGLAGWQLARLAVPRLWAGQGQPSGMPALVLLIGLTAVLVAAPPVLAGAWGAWLARRWHAPVGLACGLWSLALIQGMPQGMPLPAAVWYAPAVLVLLSGALGGWMIGLRAAASGAPG